MASIQKRGDGFTVIYDFKDSKGARRQKWESFSTKEEAVKFKKQIEYKKSRNQLLTPSDQTVEEFLQSWTTLYSKSKWSFSMYTSSMTLIRNHILPEIGHIKMQQLQPMQIEMLYDTLRTKKCSGSKSHREDKDKIPCLSSTTIRHIHTLLKTAFDKAVEWRVIERNPVVCDAPRKNKSEPNIWTPEMVRMALADIQHPMLHLAVHLAFICSLRNGEAVALKWEDIDFDASTLNVCRTLQRVSREALHMIPGDNLIQEFPAKVADKKSILVLKQPKTTQSNRLIYLTPVLRRELMMRKAQAAKEKAFLGEDYTDFGLVFALEDGYPVEPKLCEKWFKKWQTRTTLDLPPLIFHELRHSSATYKLLKSGGDVKLVQGDLGHASAKISLDTYAHVQDDHRRELSMTIAKEFYGAASEEGRENQLLKLLGDDPEMKKKLLAALLAENAEKTGC